MSSPGLQLTDRDHALLMALRDLRILTTAQVQRLLFASEQTALRRVRQLEAAGYVRRVRSPAVAHRLVTLTPRGAVAVGMPGANGTAYRPLFLEHLLGVNDFRIALSVACADERDVALAGFLADTAASHGGPGAAPRRLLGGVLGLGTHVPDGAFCLRRGGRAALFFFELDRGTETIGNPRRGLGRILRSYVQALLSAPGCPDLAREFGLAQPFRGFRVLVVTSSVQRIENIRRVWGAPGEARAVTRFIWLAPRTVLSAPDLLRARWVPLDPSDQRTYAIVGE